MRKLFGEYLLEKKLVTMEQLVSALAIQASELPSILEIIHKNKFLSHQQIYDCLVLQARKEVEFIQACKELGFWSDDLSQKIVGAVRKRRTPLGQILVQSGAIDFKALTGALDEYFSICDDGGKEAPEQTDTSPKESEKEPVSSQEEVSTKNASPPPETGDPAPTQSPPLEGGQEAFQFEFKEMEPAMKEQYLDTVSLRRVNQLTEISKNLGQDNLALALKELHTIRGAARFVGAPLTERIVAEIESLLDEMSQGKCEPAVAKGFVESAASVILELRKFLEKSSSEESYWKDPDKQKKCTDLISQAKAAKS